MLLTNLGIALYYVITGYFKAADALLRFNGNDFVLVEN
jgi:hypothetical protein